MHFLKRKQLLTIHAVSFFLYSLLQYGIMERGRG
nr:MAG TPA: hypothetical protein [Caudoviricetes sp.]